MAVKQSSINRDLEKALKNALKDITTDTDGNYDVKDKMLVINAAIKWEAVKAKMADADFGSHFLEDDNEPDPDSGG